MPIFNLAHHRIQMSLLILWPTADMRAAQENCQTTLGNRINKIT
jgi:hypothetical protein